MTFITALFLLKATNAPISPLCCLGALTVSCIFFILVPSVLVGTSFPLLGKIRYKTTEKIDDFSDFNEELDLNKPKSSIHNILEALLLFGLSTLTIGGLFKLQRWPGADPMRFLGVALVFIAAIIILIIVNRDSCDYSSEIKQVAIASLVFGLLLGTNFMFDWIKHTQYKDMHHYIEVMDAYKEQPTEENRLALAEEGWKVSILRYNPDTYNQLYALETKAKEMAKKDTNALVIYTLTLSEYSYNLFCFDRKNWGEIQLTDFLEENRDKINNNATIYVISNANKEAKSTIVDYLPESYNKPIIDMQELE